MAPSQSIPVDLPQWTLICVTRYALGRCTYIVGEVCDLLCARWAEIAPDVRNIIQRDVEEAFERAERICSKPGLGHPLGIACDIREWERVRQLWAKVAT